MSGINSKASTMKGINYSIFEVIYKNEINGNDSLAFNIQKPASGSSGYTLGLAQLDFKTNPQSAQTLLENALIKSGLYSYDQARSIAVAITSAGSSLSLGTFVNTQTGLNIYISSDGSIVEGVSAPQGASSLTLSNINHTLSGSSAAQQVIINDITSEIIYLKTSEDNWVQSTFSLSSTSANYVQSQAVLAALTPGSSTFDTKSYLLLADMSNQYGQSILSTLSNFILTQGTVNWSGGGSYAWDNSLSMFQNLENAELVTKYVVNPTLATDSSGRAIQTYEQACISHFESITARQAVVNNAASNVQSNNLGFTPDTTVTNADGTITYSKTTLTQLASNDAFESDVSAEIYNQISITDSVTKDANGNIIGESVTNNFRTYSLTSGNLNGDTFSKLVTAGGQLVYLDIKHADGSSDVQDGLTGTDIHTFSDGSSIITSTINGVSAASVAQALGNVLGGYLPIGSLFLKEEAETGIGVFLGDIAGDIQSDANGLSGNIVGYVEKSISDLPTQIASGGAGTAASYLFATLISSSGLSGAGASFVDAAAGTILSSFASTVASQLTTGQTLTIAKDFTNSISGTASLINVAGAVGALAGQELANLIVSATNQDGAIGDAIGGALAGVLGSVDKVMQPKAG